ncbi:MAG TPA: hypothetical protein VF494_05900 [Candidatus Limnocylindrales bacterium]
MASFTLIIPIEGLIWLLALPSGLLIGYYANQRSNRRAGPWRRILLNGLFASVVTGLSMVALLLVLKVLFFYGDNGYRDPGLGGSLTCSTGADCVYQRYLDADRGPALVAAGVTDPGSFTSFYWREQLSSAGIVLGLVVAGGLGGAALYGLARPKALPPSTIAAT